MKPWCFMLIPLLLVTISPICSAEDSLDTAKICYEKEDFKKSVKFCSTYLEKHTADADALMLRGKSFLALGEFDNASKDLEAAPKSQGPLEEAMANQSTLDANDADNLAYPNWIQSLVLLYVARLNAEQGRFAKAVKVCDLALKRYPVFPECMTLRASLLMEQNILYQSEEQYRQALSLRPKDWHIWLGYSRVLEKQIKYSQSLAALDRALELIKTPPYEEPELDKRREAMQELREKLKRRV